MGFLCQYFFLTTISALPRFRFSLHPVDVNTSLFRGLGLFLLLITFAGCGLGWSSLESFADDEKEAIATAYIQNIIRGDYDAVYKDLSPEIKGIFTPEMMQEFRARITFAPVTEINLIGYNYRRVIGGSSFCNISYQYEYTDQWVLLNVAFTEDANHHRSIVGLNVYDPMDQPLQEINKFTLSGKTGKHYFFLALSLLIPVFCLFTFIVCLRTRIRKRKWMWCLFILVGFLRFSINWTTGNVAFMPISLLFFGSSAMTASIYAPWVISFSIPFGAILFWFKRKRFSRLESEAVPLSDETAETV